MPALAATEVPLSANTGPRKLYQPEFSDDLAEADELVEFLRRPGGLPSQRLPAFELIDQQGIEGIEGAENDVTPPEPEAFLSVHPSARFMRESFAAGDLEEALRGAEEVLGTDPLDPEACHYADVCREQLRDSYTRKLGSTLRPVRLRQPLRRVDSSLLGPQHAFVISRIERETIVEDLIDVSPLAAHETLRIVCDLVDVGILEVA